MVVIFLLASKYQDFKLKGLKFYYENERRNKLSFSCRNFSLGHMNKNLVQFEKINMIYPTLPRYVIKRWTFQVSYMPCLHIRA